MTEIAKIDGTFALPGGYEAWRKEIIALIETAKYKAALNVNAELLALYWKIGSDIIKKQEEQGWGTQIISQLSGKFFNTHFIRNTFYQKNCFR